MKNPRLIRTIIKGATYELPRYTIDNNGIEDNPSNIIQFCKGDKFDETKHRQAGFFTETLLQTCKQYLEDVNVGELSSRETSIAITKIEEALMWLNKRSEDRKLREVQATYQK